MLIKIEELEKCILDESTNKLYVELNGMVKTQLSIENPDIKIKEDTIIIFNKENNKQSMELNLHQIMKIERINENVFNIKFDYLQSVTIRKKE